MRGIGNTLSRRQVVRGILAGLIIIGDLIIIAGTAPALADAQVLPDQATASIPGIAPPAGASDPAPPKPLTPKVLTSDDAARIRRIFNDQAHGRTADADREIAALGSKLLMGSIVADRYLGHFHRSTVTELQSWLDKYSGQPETAAIRSLLVARLPHGSAPPPAIDIPHLTPSATAGPAPEFSDGEPPGIVHSVSLDREISAHLRNNEFSDALERITRARGISPEYRALLRTEVARALFSAGWDAEAAQVAGTAWHEPDPDHRLGESAFVAGLAVWRTGRLNRARKYFEDAATAPVTTPGQQAAGAYWAARCALHQNDVGGAGPLLERAATYGTSFYGLIARRSLGRTIGLVPQPEIVSQTDLDALAAIGSGRRALALLEVGQVSRAEQEMRFLWPEVKENTTLRRALLLVVQREGLTALAAEITDRIEAAEGIPHHDFHFPVPRLHPAGGFRLNPALIYGMTRAELNFDSKAVSPAGALGLMQLMPRIARTIAGNPKLPDKRLQDPGINLELGQRWVESLANDDHVNGNLIALLASYNAGVSSFADWSEQIGTTDPLLFIEAIPLPETRRFVQRALTYTWLYGARLGLTAQSLDDIVAGVFPRFRSPDEERTLLVSWH